MQNLTIGDHEAAAIRALVRQAEDDPVAYTPTPARAPNGHLVLDLPQGHRVAFALREWKPGCLCRHLMIQMAARNGAPRPDAVEELREMFGFDADYWSVLMWVETVGRGMCVMNLLEPLDAQDRAKLLA